MGLNDAMSFFHAKRSEEEIEKKVMDKGFKLEEKYWSIIMHSLRMYARERHELYYKLRSMGKTKKQLNSIIEDMENIKALLVYLRKHSDESKNKIIY